jgi:hypothetical protein
MVGTCYAGPIEEGEHWLRPLRAWGTRLVDLIGPTPYARWQSGLDSTVVHGWNNYWKSTHLPELRDELIDVIAEHAFACVSPRSYVAMFHLQGEVSRAARGATAFGNRQAAHAITLDGVWRPGEDFGDRDTAWAKGFLNALDRFRDGVYVNFLAGDEGPERIGEAYGESIYTRLVEVKPDTTPTTSSTTTRTSPRGWLIERVVMRCGGPVPPDPRRAHPRECRAATRRRTAHPPGTASIPLATSRCRASPGSPRSERRQRRGD